MKDFLLQILSGFVVALLLAWFGIGKTKTTQVIKPKKTGKWIMVVGIILIFFGIILFGKVGQPDKYFDFLDSNSVYSFSLMSMGFIIYLVGKLIAWFQKF